MKTFIRWFGNKTKYTKFIIPHIPKDYATYIEPFIGSGALFLTLQPKKWIINDINNDLINLWIHVTTNYEQLRKYLYVFKSKIAASDDKLSYIRLLLNKMIKLKNTPYRAALFLIVKFSSFMGVIVQNGKYHIPSLNPDFVRTGIPSCTNNSYFENLSTVNEYLNRTHGNIYNTNYSDILQQAKPGDFVFLDPPYLEQHNYKFDYNKDRIIDSAFNDELYVQLKRLDAKKVKWLMTQPDTEYTRNRYQHYKIISYKVYRALSNTHKTELIIKNY